MTRRRLTCVALALVALAGCGRAEGVRDTRRALEDAGYRHVEIDLRTGGGLGVARVDADPGGPAPDTAARVIWETLPVRFDQLVVAVGDVTSPFAYQDLRGRFGPRDPSLDGRQIDEQVVRSGLRLMLLLSAGALLSVGFVVVTALAGIRAIRKARAGR